MSLLVLSVLSSLHLRRGATIVQLFTIAIINWAWIELPCYWIICGIPWRIVPNIAIFGQVRCPCKSEYAKRATIWMLCVRFVFRNVTLAGADTRFVYADLILTRLFITRWSDLLFIITCHKISFRILFKFSRFWNHNVNHISSVHLNTE